MKVVYFILALIIAVTVYSCHDKEIQSPAVNSKVLPGRWEFRNRVGGLITYSPDEGKPGNGNLMIFTKINFQFINKDSVWRSGTYSVSQGTGTNLNTGEKVDQFVFNNVPAESFSLRDDTLRLYYGAIAWDGDIQMYVKISDDTTFVANH